MIRWKVTDAGCGGGKDGVSADQLVDLPPHLPLQLKHLRHTLLDVLGSSDALCQAGGPTGGGVEKRLETKQTEILVNCQINRFIKPDKLSLLCSR